MPFAVRVLLIFAVALTSAGAMATRAYEREPPLIAHYGSEFGGIGFVFDRSGELPKIRFDGSEEILVLRWQPAAGGDRILLRVYSPAGGGSRYVSVETTKKKK